MTYRDAIVTMIHDQGPERLYWDGSFAWESHDLLEAARDAEATAGVCEELEGGAYVYSRGLIGGRLGVYRIRAGHATDLIFEVLK